MLPVLMILIFIAVVVLVIGLNQMFSKNYTDDVVKNRLDEFLKQSAVAQHQGGGSGARADGNMPVYADDGSLLQPGNQKSQLLSNIGKIISSENIKKNIAKKLKNADIPLKPYEFIAFIFICIMFCAFGGFALGRFKSTMAGLIGGAFGYLLPQIWIAFAISARKKKFEAQLVDSLTLMSNGLKAGYSFMQAMDMVAKEGTPPTSEEFKRVMQSEDFDLVITVVLIQRQIGGNLAEILDSIADTIRQRQKIRGQLNTLTAQGKLSGLLISALPYGLAFMLWMINPSYFNEFFKFSMGWYKGWYLLLVGVFMQVVGFMIIMKIMNIEV
jgi:tight adherence protein B